MLTLSRILFLCLFLVLTGGIKAQNPDMVFQVPELAGTLRFGLICDSVSSWLCTAKAESKQEGDYKVYTVKNPLKGKGELIIRVRPLEDTRGSVLQLEARQLPQGTVLCWGFGGAAGENTVAPEVPSILPEHCRDNVFSVEGNAFTVYYGTSQHLRIFCGIAPLASELRLADARRQTTPLVFWGSGKKTDAPALAAQCPLENGKALYFCFYKRNLRADYNYYMLPELFAQGSIQQKRLFAYRPSQREEGV